MCCLISAYILSALTTEGFIMQTFGISHFTARGEISPIIDCYFHNEDKPRFSLYIDEYGLVEEVIIKQDNTGVDDAFFEGCRFCL